MIVLDAYAMIALMVDEPAGAKVAELLGRGDCAMSALNVAEAADVLQRSRGIQVSDTRSAVNTLTNGSFQILDVDEHRAWRAADVRAAHYRRRDSEISMADCVLLATARPGVDSIATPDPPVIRIAADLGITVIALPDSTGREPA